MNRTALQQLLGYRLQLAGTTVSCLLFAIVQGQNL